MRQSALSVWLFINLLFFGLCGYMYLIWSQYWLYNKRQKLLVTNTESVAVPDLTIVNEPIESILELNGSDVNNNEFTSFVKTVKTKRDIKKVSGKPRFPNTHKTFLEFDSNQYKCFDPNDVVCKKKDSEYKGLVEQELNRVLLDESHVFKSGVDSRNIYNVTFNITRINASKNPRAIKCALSKVRLSIVERSDVSLRKGRFASLIPSKSLLGGKTFNTCAVVTNSAALIDSKLGKFIDSHDMVVRFNSAPTDFYSDDVGSKTTLRIVNSQVVSKPEFKFLSSKLYRNVSILAWDPANYSAMLDEWFQRPDHQMFIKYETFMTKRPTADFHLLNPRVLWRLWDVLQTFAPYRIRRNPPSSGFLGLWLSLHMCERVRMMEYIPSVRASTRCHYWEESKSDGRGCTLGTWHPLAQEKLIALILAQVDSELDSFEVFQRGVLDVRGFTHEAC